MDRLRQALTSLAFPNRAVGRLIILTLVAILFTILLLTRHSALLCAPGDSFCVGTLIKPPPHAQVSTPNRPSQTPAKNIPPKPSNRNLSVTPPPREQPVKVSWRDLINPTLDFDPYDLTLDKEACYFSFNRIIEDLKRPWAVYNRFKILDDEVDAIRITEGRIRLSIIDKKVCFSFSFPLPKMLLLMS